MMNMQDEVVEMEVIGTRSFGCSVNELWTIDRNRIFSPRELSNSVSLNILSER